MLSSLLWSLSSSPSQSYIVVVIVVDVVIVGLVIVIITIVIVIIVTTIVVVVCIWYDPSRITIYNNRSNVGHDNVKKSCVSVVLCA